MNIFDKIRWDIQRKSFCGRGIWRCLNKICRDFEEISRVLHDKL